MHGADGIPAFFLFALVIGAIAVIFGLVQRQQMQQMLLQLATRFQGRLEAGDFFTSPQVRLKFQGYPALLKFVRVGKNTNHTVFTITWPDNTLRCEIYPQDIFSGFRKLWGMEDIEIGSASFDAAYFITGTNKAAVRDLLSAEVQSVILRLATLSSANFFASREIQVKWLGGVMTVTKPTRLNTFESLEQFLSLCGLLFSAALQTRSSGIEFVADVQEPDTSETQCQVCGESLAGDIVYCANCDTPHHRECWQYFGGCSTYACGWKKFVAQAKQSSRRKAAS